MTWTTLRTRLRRTGFALSTALGVAQRGFFIPHRHAGRARPWGYPALAPLFEAAEPAMRELLDGIDTFAGDLLALAGPPPAPRFDQDWFPRLDAAAAYALVRMRRPKRIVEVGSGHSTRFMARAVADGGLETAIRCIDPDPRTDLAGLAVEHTDRLFQDLPPDDLPTLAAGDMLFIDSSHVAMPGTDVDRLYGDLLPGLPAGALVHIHDVVLPDAYPEAWAWRGYNEQLLVAGLMQGGYRLLWSSHWVATRRAEWLDATCVARLPLVPGTPETSLWLEKR